MTANVGSLRQCKQIRQILHTVIPSLETNRGASVECGVKQIVPRTSFGWNQPVTGNHANQERSGQDSQTYLGSSIKAGPVQEAVHSLLTREPHSQRLRAGQSRSRQTNGWRLAWRQEEGRPRGHTACGEEHIVEEGRRIADWVMGIVAGLVAGTVMAAVAMLPMPVIARGLLAPILLLAGTVDGDEADTT